MKIRAWLASSLARQFPRGPAGSRRSLQLLAARGERVSFQVYLRLEDEDTAEVTANVTAPAGVNARVRRIGCVPVLHHNTLTPPEELDGVGHIPGYVPDVLFPETTVRVARHEASGFWVTLNVPRECKPGVVNIRVRIEAESKTIAELTAVLRIADVVLEKRRDFPVTHWFYADAISDWYKIEPFTSGFWPLCEKYMRNYAEHGSDMIYVPVFTPPLDGVKRPTQLLGVRPAGGGRYEFDWSLVKKWVSLAQRCGIRNFEWTHLFTQWGAKHALRIYKKKEGADVLLWPPETAAGSKTYRNFLGQFLPQLENFVRREKLAGCSYFHLSDEPEGEEPLANYRQARAILKDLAPWMKVMDALSDAAYAREKLTDIPIPVLSSFKAFRAEGIPAWTYFCCSPRGKYLNRLLDTPLAKARMAGCLFYRLGCRGFLQWGYNYWYKRQTQRLIDPFHVTDGEAWPWWTYGDPFVVYPGPAEIGPIDSIRWEVFSESLQDYALLQTLGVDPEDPLLAPLKAFNDFPKTASWIEGARKKLLR